MLRPPPARLTNATLSAFVALAALLAAGCAHRVSWEVVPKPTIALPPTAEGIALAVVSDGRDCKAIADGLVAALGRREGIVVRADAPIRLEVQDCDRGQQRTVEFEVGGGLDTTGFSSASGGLAERQRTSLRGWSTANLAVISPAGRSVTLSGSATKTVTSAWVSDADLDVTRSIGLAEDLAGEVAENLANQLAPAPIALHRTVYTDAPPGSARDLHNQAVTAEQAGDLVAALRLARMAQAKEPSRVGAEYLQALASHAATVGQAL